MEELNWSNEEYSVGESELLVTCEGEGLGIINTLCDTDTHTLSHIACDKFVPTIALNDIGSSLTEIQIKEEKSAKKRARKEADTPKNKTKGKGKSKVTSPTTSTIVTPLTLSPSSSSSSSASSSASSTSSSPTAHTHTPLNSSPASTFSLQNSTPSTPSPQQSSVALPKETLRKLTSSGLQEYVNAVSTARELSPEELNELKKQKRLVKNRESAQLSRQRKREHVEHLEGIIKGLETKLEDSNKLKEQIIGESELLKKENKSLREQVGALYQDLCNAGANISPDRIFQLRDLGFGSSLAPLPTICENTSTNLMGNNTTQLGALSVHDDFLPLSSSNNGSLLNDSILDEDIPSPFSNRSARTAVTCLMVCVLLFGLFNISPSTDFSAPRTEQTSSAVVPTAPAAPLIASRVLHGNANNNNRLRNSPITKRSRTETAVALRGADQIQSISAQQPVPSIRQEDAPAEMNTKYQQNIRNYLSRKDTTYLLVNDLTRLDPTIGKTTISSLGETNNTENNRSAKCIDDFCTMGFVVPFAAVNSSNPQNSMKINNTNIGANDLVEFICKVSSVNIIQPNIHGQ